MLAEAERAIDERLNHHQFREGMTLSEMENRVGKVEAEFSQAMIQELVNSHPGEKSGNAARSCVTSKFAWNGTRKPGS